MLKYPVGLCVFECVSLRLCFRVPACECCMISFTYNLCLLFFFFPHAVFEYIPHVSASDA